MAPLPVETRVKGEKGRRGRWLNMIYVGSNEQTGEAANSACAGPPPPPVLRTWTQPVQYTLSGFPYKNSVSKKRTPLFQAGMGLFRYFALARLHDRVPGARHQVQGGARCGSRELEQGR